MGNSKTRRRLRRPGHGTVIAYLALFVALGTGSAWAAATIGPNDIKTDAVKSRHIDNGQVHGPDIGENAVGSAKVADDTTPRALTGTDVASDSLTAGDLGPDSVGSSEIAGGAVRANEVGSNIHLHFGTAVTVSSGVEGNGSVTINQGTASCAGGEQLVSGHAEWTNNNVPSTGNQTPGDEELYTVEVSLDTTAESVTAIGANDTNADHTFRAVAVCIN